MNNMLREQHPNFRGNWQDLDAFMQLANSPIRSEAREQALIAWDAYKTGRQRQNKIEGSGGLLRIAKFDASADRVVDLSGATLDGICIGFANLRGVIFDGASMQGAKLKGAYMEHCSLRDVDFSPLETGGPGGPHTYLRAANLSYADLENANLTHADLTEATLVNTSLRNTDLRGSRVYGIAAWDLILNDNESKQQDLIVTPENQPSVRVDDIEVAQFIYLMLNRQKLRNVINAVTRRGVLILGRFGGGGIDVLRAVANQLRESGYLPMLFDFEKPADRDYTETIKVLAGLAHFVIVDLSGPSVPQELMATVPDYEIPFFSILEKGRKPHSMFRDLFKFPWVARETLMFADIEEIHQMLPSKIIEPAETMLKAIQERKTTDYL